MNKLSFVLLFLFIFSFLIFIFSFFFLLFSLVYLLWIQLLCLFLWCPRNASSLFISALILRRKFLFCKQKFSFFLLKLCLFGLRLSKSLLNIFYVLGTSRAPRNVGLVQFGSFIIISDNTFLTHLPIQLFLPEWSTSISD